ncbi:glycoside hydrolase family protein [Thalassoroseus pseudoceratinae]|uniref:glycosylase n=1 Tax=Thalassoroseus pseudoceratinae TaxID=2713176 RepID=UPI001423A5DC|nr:glycosylase [Thalassoroseus pseudoceratinae]
MKRRPIAGIVIVVLFNLNAAEPSFVTAEELFPDELVHFVPYQRYPLFAGTDSETWDRKIRERGYILRHNDEWHLWYTGYNGERTATKMLGYATSLDGLNWKRHPDNPIYQAAWTEDVHVVRHDDLFYMVAEGRDDIPHMLTSRDGVHWTEVGRLDVRQRDGSPISPGPYGTPTLWIEKDTWYLFYERRDQGVWLAKSTDRKVWTNVKDTPVIGLGPAEYDRHAIALNQVIGYQGRYYGVYHANGHPSWKGPWTTCLAVSDDLVDWKKYPGNPIIRTNNSSGQLVHDGERYRLYTTHPDVRVYFPPNFTPTK